MITELALLGLGVLITVIGYLLAKRDEKRQEETRLANQAIEKLREAHQSEINELFRLRHLDVLALADYKTSIAANHYTGQELDAKFAQLNGTMEKGFNALGEDLRGMTRALTDHLNKSH